jgi:hypothetical protein
MARENARAKAARYLVEGRLILTRVGDDHVDAIARGDGRTYTVTWRPDDWSCTCEARGTCCHLLAVRSVVAVDLAGIQIVRRDHGSFSMGACVDPQRVGVNRANGRPARQPGPGAETAPHERTQR